MKIFKFKIKKFDNAIIIYYINKIIKTNPNDKDYTN